MGSPTLLDRLRAALASLLGSHYAAAIKIAERVVAVFAAAFLSKLIAGGVGLDAATQISNWQAAAGAGIAAALVFVQSLVTAAITGVPSAASLVSNTVRAQRELGGHAVRHRVPLRPRHTRDTPHKPAQRHL